jgi:hypothetical protein
MTGPTGQASDAFRQDLIDEALRHANEQPCEPGKPVPSPWEFGTRVAEFLVSKLHPQPDATERVAAVDGPKSPESAIAALQAKIDSDLHRIRLMRTLQAALRTLAGLPEEPLVDPEKPAATIRIGTPVFARLTLQSGKAAVLRGTAVNLIEKTHAGRKALEITLFDGGLEVGPSNGHEHTPQDATPGVTMESTGERGPR